MFTSLSVERKLKITEILHPRVKESVDVTVDEFREFLEYEQTLSSLQRLYKNFTAEDGTFTMFEKGTPKDKQTLNDLSHHARKYEMNLEKTPIYDMLVKEMGVEHELPDFLRDGVGRWMEEEVATGWYQNSVGVLYHYDGVVWDNVPDGKISDLEFLGG